MLRHENKAVDQPELDVVVSEDGALARICGRIDMDSSPALRASLLTMLEARPHKNVIVDLSAVTHIDSSGVATLIEALKIAQSHNTQLKLRGLEGRLLRLFQLTGILSLFNGIAKKDSDFASRAV